MRKASTKTLRLLAGIAVIAAALPAGAGPVLYDPKTVETVHGQVTRVEHVPRAGGSRPGLVLTVKADKEAVAIRCGPSWYVKQQGLEVANGDQVSVKGSRVTYAGKPVLLAAELTKGSRTVTLREADGSPRWTGRGQP
jgi:hypothetical protein